MLDDFRLKVFMAVASCGSFTAAARELGVSQPAVSQNIAELEKLVGVKLLERSRSGVALTEKGILFLEQAGRILDAYKVVADNFSVPKSILIKNVILNGRSTNILIIHNRFADLNVPVDTQAEREIDADGLAIVPPFFNSFCGSGLTSQMLACGTAFYADITDDVQESVNIAENSGMRAAIGLSVTDIGSYNNFETIKDYVRSWSDPTCGRIQLLICPKPSRGSGDDLLKKCASFARKYGLRLLINTSSFSPKYLDSLGVLDQDVIVSDYNGDESGWKLLSKRGVSVLHTPIGDIKAGKEAFKYELSIKYGCRLVLGSHNDSIKSLFDLREEAKMASLISRMSGGQALFSEKDAFNWATKNGADAFGIDSGLIAVGKLADAVLVNLDNYRLQPGMDLITSLVSFADSSCVKYVICDGRVIIQPQAA